MSFYTKIKIVLVVILSGIIFFFTYTYLNELKDNTTIIIAKQDINPHTLIKPEMVEEVPIGRKDKEMFEKNSISNIEELENTISIEKIDKGKTIVKDENAITGNKEELIQRKVMLENGEINNSYFISDNNRITTIRLDSEGAVGNKLKVGDFVDVIFSQVGDENSSFSSTIMQHIEVYDIEESEDLNGEKNISLVVTPQQAVDITYAKRQGKADLSLNASKGNSEEVYPSSINRFLKMNSSN